MKETKGKVYFADEIYDYIEREDGSKQISINKNKRGFQITIEVSGDPKEHEEAKRALREFFVKKL